ncbi:MAG TPA: DUF4384 domain-containing protein [Candidatus Bipolaricaulota bacterium]
MRHGALALAILLASGCASWADPVPQGVIVKENPADLAIEVWPAKESYLAGQRLELNVRLSQAAYVYLYAVSSQGRVTLLYPNAYELGNLRKAGLHHFPGNRYRLVVEGQSGIEVVQAIATLEPVDLLSLAEAAPSTQLPFVPLPGEPAALAAQVQGLLAQTLAQERWAVGWTQFHIVAPPSQRWVVRSFPHEAEVYLNGQLVGLTPEELVLAPPARAGQSAQVELVLVRGGQVIWSGVLRMTNGADGKLALKVVSKDDNAAVSTRTEGDTTFLDIRLQEAQPVRGEPEGPGEVDASVISLDPSFDFRRGSLGGSLSANLGGHPSGISTFGLEFGISAVRLGIGLADTADEVPEFFDVGTPLDLGTEWVLNEDPEVEIYGKLSLGTGFEGLWLELGAGLVYQVQAHVAAPDFAGPVPLDVSVLPNGYRIELFEAAGIVGLAYRFGNVLLQAGYDTHRGVVGGLGVVF